MNTNTKYIWTGAALCICFVIIFVVYSYTSNRGDPGIAGQTSEKTFSETELQTLFREGLTQQAIDTVGQPIEGFSAELLMDAYPGLLPMDFNAVSTHGGLYVFNDDRLAFVRDSDAPTSSADQTLSNEGFAILLQNITARTGAAATDRQEVADLIDRIALLDEVRASIGRGVRMGSITLIPQEVVEDSRCPKQANCIWAGTIRVRTIIEAQNGTSEYVFTQGEPVQTQYATITLARALPEPDLGGPIDPKSYRFYFQVAAKDTQ